MGVAERQQKLRSQYFFVCNCLACQDGKLREAAGPRWEAFRCHSCGELMQVGLSLFSWRSVTSPKAVNLYKEANVAYRCPEQYSLPFQHILPTY